MDQKACLRTDVPVPSVKVENCGYQTHPLRRRAPIGWSGLIASASYASGPLERCILGKEGNTPTRYAA